MFKDFSEPSLTNGIALLRDRASWPEGFKWDYGSSCRCAMGLFTKTWAKDQLPTSEGVAELIGIDKIAAANIFTHATTSDNGYTQYRPINSITPEVIADMLEELVPA